MGKFKFSKRSLEVLSEVNPILQEIMTEAIDRSPIDFGIPGDGGKRTSERQYELYLAKKTKCDGYDKKSYHQSGNAVDVYAYVDGHASWADVHLAIIAGVILTIAKEKGVVLRWGGTFGSNNFMGWDYPHFEIRG